MPTCHPDLLVGLNSHISRYSSLELVVKKYDITLFNVLSPDIISKLDAEANANPVIVSDAISLLEFTSVLECFYCEESFIDKLTTTILKRKTSPAYNRLPATLQKDLMEGYFMSNATEVNNFLTDNPYYLGVYLFIFVYNLSHE